MSKKIKLIIASTRQGRLGESVANWYVSLAKQNGVELEVVDLKEVNLPMFDAAVPPAYMPTQTVEGKAWQAVIAEGEAFIFVTPEYNRSIPASLKNAIDYLVAEWTEKPAAIVSYGYVDGGKSATKHLVDILGWQKMPIVEPSVSIMLSQDIIVDGAFVDIDAALADTKEAFLQALSALNQ